MSRGKFRLFLRGAWIVGARAALMAAPEPSRIAWAADPMPAWRSGHRYA